MSKTLALTTLIAAVLCSSCSTSPTGRKQLSLVSDQQMTTMGLSAYADMKRQIPISTDRRKTAYVRCIGNAITAEVGGNEQWEITLFDDDQVNAFALPGGKIGVYTGLLDVAETPDQLAAVMGHEVAHVLADHGKARVSASMAGQAGMLAGQILLGTQLEGRDRAVMAALGLGLQFGVMMPYGRAQESEADVLGLELSAKAGFDPRASTQLWLNMAAASGGAPPELLSTHPAPDTRIKQLNAQMTRAFATYRNARASGRTPNCRV
ncbi:MAG: M48 family metallopeptidase [Pseudomonadota bacterium]